MAKLDFCFTYYDGDAARDMSHMNRLERGAYNDIVLSQRKFGPLALEQIQKVLGRDFKICWPSIEIIMSVTEEGKYYLEWLDVSIATMKKHAKHQSDRGKSGGRGHKPELNPNETPVIPEMNPTQTLKEDGDENGDGSIQTLPKINIKKVKKEFIPPSIEQVIEYFKQNDYTEEAARKAFEHYALADWHDTEGKPVLAWKQKMHTNWFKEQYLIKNNVVSITKSNYDPRDPKHYYSEADYKSAMKELNGN